MLVNGFPLIVRHLPDKPGITAMIEGATIVATVGYPSVRYNGEMVYAVHHDVVVETPPAFWTECGLRYWKSTLDGVIDYYTAKKGK